MKDFGVQDYKIYKAGNFGKWFIVADLTTHACAYAGNIKLLRHDVGNMNMDLYYLAYHPRAVVSDFSEQKN